MFTNLIAGFALAAGLAGSAFALTGAAPVRSCCEPGAACCFPGSPCCGAAPVAPHSDQVKV
jgi:hypothetical protein